MSGIQREPASEWIPSLAVHMIAMTIGFLILKSEIHERKESKIIFTTIWFKIFSTTCIASCLFVQMFESLSYAPGFCIFSNYLVTVSSVSLYGSMCCYQLYRLYYCFANEQIHSNKGYPKWVFISIGAWGMIHALHICISDVFRDVDDEDVAEIILTSECGYNDKYEFYFYPYHLFDHATVPSYYFIISTVGFILADLLILCLYIMKISTFKKYATEEPIVYQRIMSILHKIFILTVVYELFFISYVGLIFASHWLLPLIVSKLSHLSVCYSMYLMLDHNKEQYIKFLTIIYFFRLHWICCCWRHFVIDDIHSLDREVQQSSNSTDINGIDEKNGNNNNPQSQFQTCDASVDDQKIEMPELSIATKTEQTLNL